jgi:hypothetical protein
MKKIFAVTIVGLLNSAPAFATDLTNKDSQKYEVKVQNVGTLNTSIDSSTTSVGICSQSCTVQVVGVGSVKVTGKEKAIVIEGGKLRLEN